MTWKEIDRIAAGAGVPKYRIAMHIGMSEATFTRRRRQDPTEDLERKVLAAIESLKDSD